ncbi:MAG TPA: PQQ-dependent sugar dehydrogenase [Nitrososphaeraceae archaeon]|jgi:glucose/arabinose dehydrogenase|nr:PQQ-dependent sugar dehydrogenase [Nitrososphaeraceae archaeon]
MACNEYLNSRLSSLPRVFLALTLLFVLVFMPLSHSASAQQKIPGVVASIGKGEPTIKDLNLKVETVATGLALPTTMAFIGPNDILVLEKNKGTVQRIVNGQMLAEPLLRVNVSSEVERGMLGIATSQDNQTGKSNVFLYYTESEGGEPVASRLYRYELTNEKLVNPVLLLDLPAVPGPRHNAGNIMIGPDNNLYVSVGDLDGHITSAQNIKGASGLDGSSAILKITQDGQAVGQGMLGESGISNKYYAYGLRNSFGMDFDPVTGKLWDTENGASYGDEINFIEPGFNSGWLQVQGMAPDNFNIEDLENFQGKGNYSDPEFVWTDTVGPTAIKFFGSDRLGNQYKNDIFVSDITQGNIYHFDLMGNRTNLILDGLLADKMSNNSTENQDIIFGEGFGGISDLEVGPYDGYLYVVSLGHGNIYRIVSN